MNTPFVVPADFPRGVPAAVPGVQPKLCVRLVDDKYVAGWTADELRCRHAYCDDLVQQLVIYSQRKDIENPDWTHEFNLGRTERALASKGRSGEWDVTVDEQAWIMSRLRMLLEW
jgi:hypothetical protein